MALRFFSVNITLSVTALEDFIHLVKKIITIGIILNIIAINHFTTNLNQTSWYSSQKVYLLIYLFPVLGLFSGQKLLFIFPLA